MSENAFAIPAASIERQLDGGYFRDWLVAGPIAVPVPDLEQYPGEDFKTQIAKAYYTPSAEISMPPAEEAPLDVDSGEGETADLKWQAVHTGDDRFVDVSAFYHTCHHLRTWAYCQTSIPEAGETTFVLTTNGPADVWINGRHVHRQLHFHHQIPHRVSFAAPLIAGRNEILVRFEGVAVRECPYVLALQAVDVDTSAWSIHLPTTLDPITRREKLEEAMAHAYLTKAVYNRDDTLQLHWADEMTFRGKLTIRLQTPDGRIYAETSPDLEPGSITNFGAVYQYRSGDYQILIMSPTEEYYIHGMRVRRTIPLRISSERYSEQPYGTYSQRRIEALQDAATRRGHVFAEIAKMGLGRWDDINEQVVLEAVENINRRADCSDFYLVGLLGAMIRHLDDPAFPDSLRQPLASCVLNFRYWMDEPGDDAMCFWSENHQILFHTCAVLAGQLYPGATFANSGESGAWHRKKGERMARSWLDKRAAGGFKEWDSNTYFEEDVLALSHLADLAEEFDLAEIAAIILDKLFFSLAINSFHGVFGSTHGRTYSPFIQSGRLEPTSGISRLMWGMGAFNSHILGTVSLASADGYELPAWIAAIAADAPDEMWNREQHAGVMEAWCDLDEGEWSVNKVTYKTPDYMLSSAQDYHAGESGYQQHIWQATFGPDAVVFVTHPPCVSDEGSHRPNVWHGNVVLPRVAQWKDVLFAVHNLPDDDWMGFTHAYFPTAAFDEYTLRDGWAFARKGDGYLALTAAQGMELITRGDQAFRELRSYGHQNTWLGLMGRSAWDGDFEKFQSEVLALPMDLNPDGATLQTLRQQAVRFGWRGPLLVDGAEQPLAGFPHYENPYATTELDAEIMEIWYQDQVLRLHLK
jgi:hypothetical protein